MRGGKSLDVDAPLDREPLFVRAGSIVPLGPDLQYAAEKPTDPIELRLYTGADGSFTIYEDEGDTYNYEKGTFATIPIRWENKSSMLTVGDRTGSFPGMLQQRTFHVVVVRPGHGTGIEPTSEPERSIRYDGKQQTVHFETR